MVFSLLNGVRDSRNVDDPGELCSPQRSVKMAKVSLDHVIIQTGSPTDSERMHSGPCLQDFLSSQPLTVIYLV